MENIKSDLTKYDKAYYSGKPLIPDWQYDILKSKARAEGIITTLTKEDAPEQSKHSMQMYSLTDAFSVEEAKSLLVAPLSEYYATPKADGAGIEIKFSAGAVTDIILRGDGVYGESVIRNAEYIKLPDKVPPGNFSLFVEAVFTYEDFNKMNMRRKELKLKPLTSLRAAAAGTLKLKSRVNDDRKLTIVPYGSDLKQNAEKFYQFLDAINLDLIVLQFKEITEKGLNRAQETLKRLPYPTDGIVFKLKNYSSYINAGFTSDVPKGAFAYKFEELRKPSSIVNIDFSVGATGKVTPIIEIVPIDMDGSVIKRASIHNYAAYTKICPGIGDTVFVVKKGEIIPQIVKLISTDTPRLPFIEECPTCNSTLEQENNDMYCLNEGCESRILKKFLRFKDKLAFDINIGEVTLQKLLNAGLTSRAEMFKLTVQQISNLDRLGEKSALKLKNSLENAKDIRLDKFIYSLSIKDIGYIQARNIAKSVRTFENLLLTTEEQFLSIEGIGKTRAKNLDVFLSSEEGILYMNELLDAGVEIHPMPKELKGTYENKIFVLTGEMWQPRDLITAAILENGGIVRNNVSSKTHFLIIGVNPSDKKLQAAKNHNITPISHEKFKNWALFKDSRSSA